MDQHLPDFGIATVTLPGLGHNAHVEDPHGCAGLLDLGRQPRPLSD
jgi:hypothetical protein